MSNHPHFNLALLRALGSKLRNTASIARLDQLKVSRRTFLALSAAASADAAIPPILRGEGFSVVRERSRIQVLVNDKPRWTIDPSSFGNRAKLDLVREDGRIMIALSNALFPGTTLPADFESVIFKQLGTWMMNMEMGCGIRVNAPLLAWLDSQVPAAGLWHAGVLRPFEGLELSFTETPKVCFTRDWSFEVSGAAKTSVDGLRHDLRSDGIRMQVSDSDPETQIVASPPAPQTSFHLSRGAQSWRVDLRRESEQGWAIAHDDEQDIFDELRVEAADTSSGPVHSALLYQSDKNSSLVRFFTGGGLVSDLGEPFHVLLTKPRLAFSLSEAHPRSALIAETDPTPRWAHAADASFLFSGSSETPHFELLEGDSTTSSEPQVIPSLCEICFPDETTCTTLKFGVPRPVPFTWADLAAPFERLWGCLHLLPSQHNFNFLLDEGDRLQVDRPSDLLSLGFRFKGMRLETGCDPRIVPNGKDHNPQVTVIFPPQHVAEEAFYHSADGVPDTSPFNPGVPIGVSEYRNYYNDQSANPTPAQIDALKKILDPDYLSPPIPMVDESSARALLAGESQLVFSLPADGHRAISFHLKDLLGWTNWTQKVADVAKSTFDPKNRPNIVLSAPVDVTSIEFPYHLNLSPSELASWSHSIDPARYQTRVTELWHTRLAVVGKQARDPHKPFDPNTNFKLFPDETNSKDRTVRAIWSPDFVPVTNPTCSSQPGVFPVHYSDSKPGNNPFRMSLDTADRNELVHLTSNYFVPEQATLCSTGSPTTDPLSTPLPVNVERMILTSMGGYLTSLGAWSPAKVDLNNTLTIQQWKHIATLGRDQYVRVVYKGFLLPFGMPASLVKVTERVFQPTTKGVVAVLHQHMYIVIQNPIKQCRVLGEANMGRGFNFNTIEALTLVTPYLDPVVGNLADGSRPQTQSLFWPCVEGHPFYFRFRFNDVARGVSEASLPVVFADAAVAQTEGTGPIGGQYGCTDAIELYNHGSFKAGDTTDWLATPFSDQKVAFAESVKLGDTQYDASLLRWRVDPLPVTLSGHITPLVAATVTLSEVNSGFSQSVESDSTGAYLYPLLAPGIYNITVSAAGFNTVVSSKPFTLQGHDDATLDANLTASANPHPVPTALTPTTRSGKVTAIDLYRRDLPFFYPAVDYAKVTSSSIKRVTGNTTPTKVVFFPDYLASGFNAKKNRGEIILQVEDDQPLNLTFGANNNVTQAGGLSNPDASIVGFSRQSGPVGGTHSAPGPTNPANISPANPRGTVSVQSLNTFSTGNFDPASFFGGLTSAKILGAVKLSDIIAPLASGLLSNLGKAPQMLEQSLFTLEDALDDVVDAIRTFQDINEPGTSNPNVIAQHLQQNAQAVYNAQTQKGSNAIDEVIADAELVNTIVQYATALESLLRNPSALAQEVLLDELTVLIDSAWIQQLAAQFISFRDAFTQQLDSALATLLTAIEDKAQATLTSIAAVAVTDTIYGLAQGIDFATGVQTAFGDLAPNLEAVCDLVATVKDLRTRINSFVSSAGSISPGNAPTSIPALFDDVTSILDDLLEIYQCAGFLGLVTVDQTVISDILKAETDVQNLWLGVDYLQDTAVNLINAAVDKVATEYSILAASDDVATAREILQNVRQLQRSTQALLTYAKQIDAIVQGDATSPPQTLNPKEVRRRVELVQQLQQDVLGSLAALQTISNQLPPLAGGGVDPRIAQLTADVNAVVPLLTIADQLTGPGTIESKLAVVVATNPALAAHTADLQAQLTALRQQLQSDTGNVAFKLQHYAISLAYQGSCAAIAEWNAYLAEPTLKAALTAVQGLNTLATTIATLTQVTAGVVCNIGTLWQNFKAALAAANTIGPLIEGLFAVSIQGVDDAFAAICSPQETNPSLLLHKSHQLVTAFDTLITDVRSRVNNVASIAEFYVTHAQELLPLILAELPVPTSVSLSYDWTPDIQDWEPVFTLGDDATFTVSATATVALTNLTTQPAIQPSFDISATLTKFSINLIGTPSFVIVDVDSLQFTSQSGNTPNCHLELNSVRFGDAMQFAQSLAAALDPSEGPFIELADASLRAGFRFGLPVITMGAFTIMQLAIEVAVALPFNGDPVRCELGISDQQQPFLLSCGIYGGGGFLQLQLGLDGVQLLQGALEFGLVAAISIGPLEGNGFVVAGIYFRIAASDSTVCGFVHAHGHMDIFGLITLDVDLYVSTCYDGATGAVTGIATFTVQVSILFFSESFSLSAQYSFGGSTASSRTSSRQLQTRHSHAASSQAYLNQTRSLEPSSNGAANPPQFVDQKVWTEYFNAFVN